MSLLTRNYRGEMPFLDHLEELRWRILWTLLAIFAGSVVGFILVLRFEVLDILISPFYEVMGEEERLIFLSPTEPFFLLLRIGILVGVVLVSPILIYQVWSFLSPALERHEKRAIIPALYLGVVLFAAGVAMSYHLALPVPPNPDSTFNIMYGNTIFKDLLRSDFLWTIPDRAN